MRGRQRQSGGGKLLLASKLQPGCAQAENTRTVVGADVEGLFPALDDIETANLGYKAVIETDITFKNINYKKGLEYVAMHLKKEERIFSPLRRVLPLRSSRKGTIPGVTGLVEDEDDKWIHSNLELTKWEDKLVVASVV